MLIEPRPTMKVPSVIYKILDELDNSLFVREDGKLYARYDTITLKEMDGKAHALFFWRGIPVHAEPIGELSIPEQIVLTGIAGRMEVNVNAG